MEDSKEKNISVESYKGVRDFYPEDMYVQNYIFGVMREVVESYGYVEYSASILESAELYKAKSGEEIVNDQTYSFTDRGGRHVTLRPEMTPTVARMVARNKHDLALPLRWYSIPNLFRYEQPQRGRLREHWQLNADLFGVKDTQADIEIIAIAHKIMKRFGARAEGFRIEINNRALIQSLYNYLELSEKESYSLSKLIDKKEKMSREEFVRMIREIIGDQTEDFISILSAETIDQFASRLPSGLQEEKGIEEVRMVLEGLKNLSIENVAFKGSLMRGFDYYTGIVFEVFDTGPENRRSLFGGGRYDDLLDIFGKEKVTAVGFGMGDVTTRDYLETYHLLPPYRSSTDLYLCHAEEELSKEIAKIADTLRERGLTVAVDLSNKKVGDQIKTASRQGIPFVMVIGGNELKSGLFKVKELSTATEKEMALEAIPAHVKK